MFSESDYNIYNHDKTAACYDYSSVICSVQTKIGLFHKVLEATVKVYILIFSILSDFRILIPSSLRML